PAELAIVALPPKARARIPVLFVAPVVATVPLVTVTLPVSDRASMPLLVLPPVTTEALVIAMALAADASMPRLPWPAVVIDVLPIVTKPLELCARIAAESAPVVATLPLVMVTPAEP